MRDMMRPDWFELVPKIELHLHLEGAIPPAILWELIQKYGGDPTVPDSAALEAKLRYRDFPQFLETWMWKNQYLREYEDFERIGEAVALHLASQNVVYAEIFFSAPDFRRRGLATQKLAAAVREGLDRVEQLDISLVADLVRDYGPDDAMTTLPELAEAKDDLDIVGIGIGGSEHEFPPEPFAAVYEEARALGFHTSAHAGEGAGPESIWGAIRALQVERIGHGTRAAEDAVLVDYLGEHRIPLEMCPVSNLRTGVVESIEAHPIKQFLDRGLCVTVNTDDPAMFNTSLAAEFEALVDVLGFDTATLRRVTENALEAAWCRRGLIAALRATRAGSLTCRSRRAHRPVAPAQLAREGGAGGGLRRERSTHHCGALVALVRIAGQGRQEALGEVLILQVVEGPRIALTLDACGA